MENLKKTGSGRNVGADIIRCLAFMSVVCVHFFVRVGYYDNVFEGEKMFIMTFIRSFFIICVPLYMTLSGYLSRHKKPEIKYYKKIGKTYLTYILAAIFCFSFSVISTNGEWSFGKLIASILNFTATPYGWYVEMYLGLFILIPFLNILYNNIPTQNLKKLLILTMVITTSLPSVVNYYNFQDLSWLTQPSTMQSYTAVIPDWWVSLYPLTYYFIGCYLSEYGLKLKKVTNVLLIIATITVSSCYTFWRSYKSTFAWGHWSDYNSLFNVILTVLVFAFFININYDKTPGWIAKIFKSVSGLCFGAYLIAWPVDMCVYPVLVARVPEVTDRIYYFVPICILIIACDLVIAYIMSKIQVVLEMLFSLVSRGIKRCAVALKR